MRFHRNAGARGLAEWVCITPAQDRIFCYARLILAKGVTFEHNAADGWALGEPKWLWGLAPGSKHLKVAPEALAVERPWPRVPVEGWLPLRYVGGKGFFCAGQRLLGARWMLLGPGLTVVKRVQLEMPS